MQSADKKGFRPFQALYDKMPSWAAHPRAEAILGTLSFAESSFFPIPPDVMLAPMSLAQPLKALRFALVCTLTSVAGGLLGYLIGRQAFHWIEPFLMDSHYAGTFQAAVDSFDQWGAVYILLAGFTPIPYKIFTISAGVVGMPLLPFVAGSLVGRGARFFLVAGLIRMLGEKGAEKIRLWVDFIGWAVLVLVLLAAAIWLFTSGSQ